MLYFLLLKLLGGILGCGTGYYEDQDSCDCEICPIGTYNNQEAAELCIQCPSGQTTLQEGSNTSSNCQPGKLKSIVPHF